MITWKHIIVHKVLDRNTVQDVIGCQKFIITKYE